MCREDLKIGRSTIATQKDFTLDPATPVTIPADPYRTSITFCQPSAGNAWWGINGNTAVGIGIPILSAGNHVTLDIYTHGTIVQREWTGISSAGNPTESVLLVSAPFGPYKLFDQDSPE